MAKSVRSIATLSLTFGLVSIPVKVYSATESAAAIRFRLMAASGARVRQQYVADAPPIAEEDEVEAAAALEREPVDAPRRGRHETVVDFPARRSGSGAAPASTATPMPTPTPTKSADADEPDEVVVERSSMLKGYEFEKGRFVVFTPEELKALQDASRQTIDIVSFIPEGAVDPIYYDKAYFLAPDRRGAKPYHLLRRALRETGRSALAKWAFRAKEYVVQIRAAEGGMVLQQLLYADEVRSLADLHVPLVEVKEPELKLALQLIEQISEDAYDPTQFVDEEKARILAAVGRKIAGEDVVATERPAPLGGQVIDLMAALRASLRTEKPKPAPARAARSPAAPSPPVARKAARRSAQPESAAPTRARAKK